MSSSFFFLIEPLVNVLRAVENLSKRPVPNSSSKSVVAFLPSVDRSLFDAFFFLMISSLSPKGLPSPVIVLNL